MRRRHALLGGLAAAGLAAGSARMLGRGRVPGSLTLPGMALGHRMRDGGLPEPAGQGRADVLIIGGGMAGLSAAWRLRRLGIEATLLELEPEIGGNAAWGVNAVSAYPWGAHYVPALTDESVHAAELFEEIGIITGRTASGDPVYNEFFQCADPHERLFLLGRWQEDLVPRLGASADDRRQYAAFFRAMDAYRTARGSDGRRAFVIPVELSSADERFRALDQVNMQAWMRAQGWNSELLHWFVDYCCRDDFGAHSAETSAWAGIHYFASRDRGGQEDPPVLTWPQGNGYIVQQLQRRLAGSITTGVVAWRVRGETGGVSVNVFDPARGATTRISAKAAVLATPRFVADRLLGTSENTFVYSPWMVANITLDALPGGAGVPLAWDNVIYGSPSLGYVVANHQSLERVQLHTVLTYYWPLCDEAPDAARRTAAARPLEAWQAMVLDELLRVHPELQGAVRSVDVRVWGHGMVRPTPGTMWGAARAAAGVQRPPVFFAHSDMSGLSLFEEANFRGVQAADAVAAYLRG